MRYIAILILGLAAWLWNGEQLTANTIRPGQPAQRESQVPDSGDQPQAGQQESRQGAGQAQEGTGANAAEEDSGESEANGGEQPKAGQGEEAAEGQEAGNPETGSSGAHGAGDEPQEASQGKSGERGSAQDAGQAEAGAGDRLTINSIGNLRSDVSGKPLVLPENSENMDFLNGDWIFDKELKGPAGEALSWDFSAKNGAGVATLKDRHNNIYEAPMSATLEDGVLRMRTDTFTSKSTNKVYAGEYIECRNGKNGAVCKGSDGFGEWDGEQIYSAMSEKASTSHNAAQTASKQPAQQENMVELAADGAEIPEEVLKSAEKATMGAKNASLASLAGHWRYSQDLARKADGSAVSLEFHFDKDGRGYSLIRSGEEKPFRAPASAEAMKDGTLRIKTENYSNGSGTGYYPSFMECKGKTGQALDCNLSNGWMHSNNGRLVDIDSYQENMQRNKMEELMPGGSPSAEGAQGGQENGATMDDLFANAAEEAQKAAASSTARPQRSEELQLPQRGDSVAFMEGQWICQTGLASTKTNEPVVLEFKFNKNGKGTSTIVEKQSGQVFRASAQASFRNGVLRVNTSQFMGRNGAYNANSIVCRDNGGQAQCRGKNGDVVWNANFLRK